VGPARRLSPAEGSGLAARRGTHRSPALPPEWVIAIRAPSPRTNEAAAPGWWAPPPLTCCPSRCPGYGPPGKGPGAAESKSTAAKSKSVAALEALGTGPKVVSQAVVAPAGVQAATVAPPASSCFIIQ